MAPSRVAMSVWIRKVIRLTAEVRHNGRMAKAPDFKPTLTRVIVATGGNGVELATLEDAVRCVGLQAQRPP